MSITVPNSTQYDEYLCLFTSNESDKRSRLYLSELKHVALAAMKNRGGANVDPIDLNMNNWDSKRAEYFRDKYGLGDNETHPEWFGFLVDLFYNRGNRTMAQLNTAVAPQPASTIGTKILNVIRKLANAAPGSFEDVLVHLVRKLMGSITGPNGRDLLPTKSDWGSATDFQYNNNNNILNNNLIGTVNTVGTPLLHAQWLWSAYEWIQQNQLTIQTVYLYVNTNQNVGGVGNSVIMALGQAFSQTNGTRPRDLISWNNIQNAGGAGFLNDSTHANHAGGTVVQSWINLNNELRTLIPNPVVAPGALHQQACLSLMQQLIIKINGLIRKTAFGYKYDKYLVNSTLQAFVNNAAIPVTPSSFLTDFSDVQDVNQTKEKYIRKSDGLLYEVKPDGSHELVELNSAAIQNLTEANKCLGTGFENDNTWQGPNTCAQYLDECIRGGDIAQCKNYLQNINFWNNAAKEVDAMQPLIAFKTLQSFEFGRVNTQLPNGQTIERVQTWSEWIDTLKNKVNPQELTQISGNVKLQEYLNLIVKKVNENPAILNKSYIGEVKTVTSVDPNSKLGKFGLQLASPFTNNILSSILKTQQTGNQANNQVALSLGLNTFPGLRFNLVGGASYSEEYLAENLKQQHSIILALFNTMKSRLSKMGKSITPADEQTILKLIQELKEKERKLHKIILMTQRYQELLIAHGVQDPTSALTINHLNQFVEQRNNYFQKVQTKQNNLMSIIKTIAESVQNLSANAKPADPLKVKPL